MQLVLDLLVPGIIAGVSCYGMAKKVDVYEALLQGAAKGLEILLRILPALVTLLTVVAMLRASGALDLAAQALGPVLEKVGIPPETVGLMVVRPISGSAALGVGSELITTYGPDSAVGRTAAVMLGSTETTFYTIAVYFGAAGIKRTRYAVPAALCADLAGFFFASLTVRPFLGGGETGGGLGDHGRQAGGEPAPPPGGERYYSSFWLSFPMRRRQVRYWMAQIPAKIAR